jgi:hypothetical protein
MLTERDCLAQRSHKGFAIGTGSQVPANVSANVSRELIVDIGGQLTKDAKASTLVMAMAVRAG